MLRGENADVCAIQQEKQGSIYKLHHRGRIAFRSYIIWADEATYNSDTGDVEAEGHVLLEGSLNDEHIQATRGTYNVQSETGRFYHVIGTIGAKQHGGAYFLTTSNPFFFTGKVVDKTGPQQYVVHHGTLTSCEMPHPKWRFSSVRSVINIGGNAHIYLSTFRVYGIPILYFPFVTHPVERQPRHSGFLMPNFGTSNIKGTIFGDAFYWAISRNMDALIGAQVFSRRGWAEHGEFRVVPTQGSFIDMTYFGVQDRGAPKTKQDQGGQEVRLSVFDSFKGFRAAGNIDYLSSLLFRYAWAQIFTSLGSEVVSQGFVSKSSGGYSYNAWVQRYQDFLGFQSNQVITVQHLPSLEFSSVDRQFRESGFYWSLDTALEGLNRSQPPAAAGQPSFSTASLVGRFDFNPNVSLPLHLRGWSLRPQLGVRETLYTEGQQTTNSLGQTTVTQSAIDELVNRKAAEFSAELRPPSVERLFKKTIFGNKLKHVIEPRAVYRKVSGIDNFSNILRFDWRDILSDTNEVEYGIINRLYTKKESAPPEGCTPAGVPIAQSVAQSQAAPWQLEGQVEPENEPASPQLGPASTSGQVSVNPPEAAGQGAGAATNPCPPPATSHELITWEIAQKYFLDPTFGGALVNGQQNVFATTSDFDGIAFLRSPRHLSPLISRLRLVPGAIDFEWDVNYDFSVSRINFSSVSLGYRFGQWGLSGSETYLRGPIPLNPTTPDISHYARGLLSYGSPLKHGLSGAASMAFDEHNGFLQYFALQSTYNWNCCGITVDFRRFKISTVRNENQYRFMFSLANIGSFGNLTRRYRIY